MTQRTSRSSKNNYKKARKNVDSDMHPFECSVSDILKSFLIRGVFSEEISRALGYSRDDVLSWIGGEACPLAAANTIGQILCSAQAMVDEILEAGARELWLQVYESEAELLRSNKYWSGMSGRAHLVHAIVLKLASVELSRRGVKTTIFEDRAAFADLAATKLPDTNHEQPFRKGG